MESLSYAAALPLQLKEVRRVERPVDLFVDKLFQTGQAHLRTPLDLGDRRFMLTYRHANNPSFPEKTVSLRDFTFTHLKFHEGYTDVIGIDLFEVMAGKDRTLYLPIGHRDFSVARINEGMIVANADYARGRNLLSHHPCLQQEVFEVADHIWSDFLTLGIDVVGERTSPHVRERLAKYLKSNELETSELDWNGYGFARLLMAVGYKIADRLGVTHVDTTVTLSNAVKGLSTSMGLRVGSGYIPFHDINMQECELGIFPFIPHPMPAQSAPSSWLHAGR